MLKRKPFPPTGHQQPAAAPGGGSSEEDTDGSSCHRNEATAAITSERELTVHATSSSRKDYKITDSGNSNMRVIVRIRPENEMEIRSNCETVIKPLDDHVLVFDPKEDNMPQFETMERFRKRRPFLTKKHKDLRFAFDRVFDETVTQHDVFESTTKTIIDGLLDGVNCSVFAYGATGAGKTHTMLGNEENPGVMFLTTMELYRRIEQLKFEKTCEVAVTYLEVYNETIQDLLVPSGPLAVREDGQNGLIVSGLSQHQPKSAEDLLKMLASGNKNRTQHPTDVNATSSRSHAVFQVYVNQRSRSAGLSAEVTQGKMSLIDLAGSERATVTTNRGARLREGANINKSLLALGNCINALAANKEKSSHVPYRNSKLTRLLKDSLGGNCRTVMIANISPSGLSYEDTYNTLRYADRAKQIKTKLVRNVVNVDYHVTRYRTIVVELQKEITELKARLSTTVPCTSYLDITEATRLRRMVQEIYNERANLRKDMADLDATERDTLLRIFRKERDLQRIEVLTGNDNKIAKIKCKLEYLHRRLCDVKEQKTTVHQQLSLNNERIGQTQSEVNISASNSSDSSEALSKHMQIAVEAHKSEAECSYQWKQTKHLLRYIKNQEKEISRTEKLFSLSLELVRKQYQLLQATNCLTPVVRDLFDSLIRQVEGEKEVLWASENELQDSLCNISVSTLSSSQQALFDTIVSHSSPLRKGAGSRYSSPTSSASLGILTNSDAVASETSCSSVQNLTARHHPLKSPTPSHRTKSPILPHPLSERRVAPTTPPASLSTTSSQSTVHSDVSLDRNLAGKVLSVPVTSPGKKKRPLLSPPPPTIREREVPEREKQERSSSQQSQQTANSSVKFTETKNVVSDRSVSVHLTHTVTKNTVSNDLHKRKLQPRGQVNLAQLTSISPADKPVAPAPSPPVQGFEDNFVTSYLPTDVTRQLPIPRQLPGVVQTPPPSNGKSPVSFLSKTYCLTPGGQKLPVPSTTPVRELQLQSPFCYPPPPDNLFSPMMTERNFKPNFLPITQRVPSPIPPSPLNHCVTSLSYNDSPVSSSSQQHGKRPNGVSLPSSNHLSNPLYIPNAHLQAALPSVDMTQSYPAQRSNGQARPASPVVTKGLLRSPAGQELNSTYVVSGAAATRERQNPSLCGLGLNSTVLKGRTRKNKKSPINVPVKPPLSLLQVDPTSNKVEPHGSQGEKHQPRYLALTKSAAIKRVGQIPTKVTTTTAQKENQPYLSRSCSMKNGYRLQPTINRTSNPRSQSTSS